MSESVPLRGLPPDVVYDEGYRGGKASLSEERGFERVIYSVQKYRIGPVA
ncbi:MAG: hypothetical protein HXS52_03360 [Theionarchaea archaeon]|nr:hypothetical protein [Theionarchaea archaeon]MBU7036944.1 hypothetical protein [Theionarchaea archaeon]